MSFDALFGGPNPAATLVMQEIRLPRAILAVLIGATLGLSGAVLQGYLRNPLADPSILGISSAAAFGAVLAIYYGPLRQLRPSSCRSPPWPAPSPPFSSSTPSPDTHAGTITLILAGLAISTLAGAMTTLALNLSPNPYAALEIVFWMLGSLTDRSWLHVSLAAPSSSLGWACSPPLGPRPRRPHASALTLPQRLGIDLARTRTLIMLGAAMSIGAATAVAGAIGFVGLVVPHVLRPLVGQQPSRLLPAQRARRRNTDPAAADVAVRVIAPARDIKLGVLTALIGAPFFVWLVFKTRQGFAMTTALATRNLCVALGRGAGRRLVLDAISVQLNKGEIVGILGPNGAGKSTLIPSHVGLVPLSSGQIELLGRRLDQLPPLQRARLAAYVPQDREIAWSLSVERVTALGRHPHRPAFAGLTGADQIAIERAMTDADVISLRHRPVMALSGWRARPRPYCPRARAGNAVDPRRRTGQRSRPRSPAYAARLAAQKGSGRARHRPLASRTASCRHLVRPPRRPR